MSDPVLALILVAAFFFVVVAAHWFKTLDTSPGRDARVPMIAGVISGVVLRFIDAKPLVHITLTGIVMTLAALYVRLMGRESEATDGMTLGAITGAAAAVPLVLTTDEQLIHLAECILAGAMAGYGVTFALTHVRDRLRQALIDAVTAALAIFAAWLPSAAVRERVSERDVAITATSVVPLLIVATVFKQWRVVRAELRHEAALGFMNEEDVHPTAHPLRRLGRAGWHDAAAHREFVRIARTIALRKRQQRGRSEEVARLYQLEVIKLRMQLQEMSRIDRAMRAHAERSTP